MRLAAKREQDNRGKRSHHWKSQKDARGFAMRGSVGHSAWCAQMTVHYVDDPGGSGKSFLFVKLLHLVRGKGAEVTSSVGGNASGKKKKYNNRREDSWYSGGKKSRVETGEAQSARREVPFRSASAQR